MSEKIQHSVHPGTLSIEPFDYLLPEDRIAYHPLPERDQSKLLIYKNGLICDDIYRNLSNYIPTGSFMVFNNTRVIEARLMFQKDTGGMIEVFCLEPDSVYAGVSDAMSQVGSVRWLCLIGGASKWKKGLILSQTLRNGDETIRLEAKYLEKRNDAFLIELTWNGDQLSFAELLHIAGHVPLPPYIKRKDEPEDAERYQTIYAKFEGSVAAPTAGLHFTETVLDKLKNKGVHTGYVTLHVGAGTFKPVKAERMADHDMHAEFMELDLQFIKALRKHIDSPVVAVGTTSLRTLESLYWLGFKLLENPAAFNQGLPGVLQWEAYEYDPLKWTAAESLDRIMLYMQEKNLNRLIAKTEIIIAPGYRFKTVKGLVTNFHQPRSTLLLLVAALVGEQWKNIYDYALKNDFRFLSYGDGSLLWNESED